VRKKRAAVDTPLLPHQKRRNLFGTDGGEEEKGRQRRKLRTRIHVYWEKNHVPRVLIGKRKKKKGIKL